MQNTEPNLNHLNYFLTTARLGSFAKAAKVHRVSQPAISLAITKLEESFNVPLMLHLKNRFKLTPEGEKLVQEAPQLIKMLQELRESLQIKKSVASGPLNIVSSMGVAPFYLIKPMKFFSQKYSGVNFTINIGDVKTILDQIQNNQSEIGIYMDDHTKNPFHKKLLHQGEFVAIIPNRKSGLEQLDETKKIPLLITDDAPGINEFETIVKRKIKKQSFHYHKVESWELIIDMVSAGIGIGIIPEFMLEGLKDKIKIQKDLSEVIKAMTYKIVLIHKGEHQLSREGKLFLKQLE
jgi:DNA-binding transcriptional LysR family regulator